MGIAIIGFIFLGLQLATGFCSLANATLNASISSGEKVWTIFSTEFVKIVDIFLYFCVSLGWYPANQTARFGLMVNGGRGCPPFFLDWLNGVREGLALSLFFGLILVRNGIFFIFIVHNLILFNGSSRRLHW